MRLSHLPHCWVGIGACLIVSLAHSGCSSSGRRSPAPVPQPLLFARSLYFDGRIEVEATLGPFRRPLAGGLDRRPPEPGDGEEIPVTGGGFGGRDVRDPGTGFLRGLDERGAFGNGAGAGARSRPGAEAGMPRQSLTVQFRSSAAEPLTLRVVEVKSAIGNFVPVPEFFPLAPGAVQALEPMRASYGEPIDELELLVVLRLDGHTETKVMNLTLANPAAR